MKRTFIVLMVIIAGFWAAAVLAQQGGEANTGIENTAIRVAADATPSFVDLLNRGGPMMYPLYLCSIVVVAFAIERAVRMRRAAILPPDVVAKIRRISVSETSFRPAELLDELKYHTSPIARVIVAGLRSVKRPLPELEKAIEDAGQREADALRRGCKVFSIVSSVSPLLGLLGTVMGMIKAFMTVAAQEEALGRTELLAAGIYQALVTTAAGLCIAIPSLVLYYLFIDKGDRLVSEMDEICIDLVETLKLRGDVA